MRELPILFNAPMVRAILEGRKTVTRRVAKGMALDWLAEGMFTPAYVADPGNGLCPYGQVGDRLWVKEGHALEHAVDGAEPPHADGRPILHRPDDDVDGVHPLWTQPHYRATDPAPDLTCERPACAQCRDHDMGPHWRSPIHMPRWASRITLEVTAVRVERLQDITEDEAQAEGVAPGFLCEDDVVRASARYVNGFRMLWDDLAKDGTRWADNPWVWVVEFRRIETEVPYGGG
ncbi:hypothetical protein [Luteibacter yeojuensis]|uniref:hypothetical protein n=1 Tax=Luteibacter yeojuensis TaxID=345309 RepID=UPI001966491A|nr:hypothetical protein [Luteibacter yeojuensis]